MVFYIELTLIIFMSSVYIIIYEKYINFCMCFLDNEVIKVIILIIFIQIYIVGGCCFWRFSCL